VTGVVFNDKPGSPRPLFLQVEEALRANVTVFPVCDVAPFIGERERMRALRLFVMSVDRVHAQPQGLWSKEVSEQKLGARKRPRIVESADFDYDNRMLRSRYHVGAAPLV
jgi:hypothetical protein